MDSSERETCGGEEREEGDGETGRDGPYEVLDVLAGGVVLAVLAVAAQHQAHGDTGDGGVDPAVVHQAPDGQCEREVDVPAADAHAEQEPEEDQAA